MKENKFRVWDKVNKTYKTPDNFYHAITIEGAIRALYCYGIENECDMIDPLVQKNYDIEFYIGREDKNNKEIYEGDIVNLLLHIDDDESYKNPDNWSIFTVEWHEKECGFFPFFYYAQTEIYDIEIIGNIHENPELLETEE